ncbi:MAG TPA: GNAT family protein [Micromonosporaceae bacterium]|nr:GNAT family protein [Micromonosporaceae bacterium]
MTEKIWLTPVDEQILEPLLAVAVAEADPDEVMPPVPAPPGWSPERRDAFRQFQRASFGGLDGPTGNQMYAIVSESGPLGVIRMARCDEPDTVETGIWLARSARGRGTATIALRLLLFEAARAGACVVVAETTAGNAPALGLLRRFGAVLRPGGGDAVRAEFQL